MDREKRTEDNGHTSSLDENGDDDGNGGDDHNCSDDASRHDMLCSLGGLRGMEGKVKREGEE